MRTDGSAWARRLQALPSLKERETYINYITEVWYYKLINLILLALLALTLWWFFLTVARFIIFLRDRRRSRKKSSFHKGG